ncbi:MAG: hypothetical protein ABW128_09330 [Rhizorhabdus sp.]
MSPETPTPGITVVVEDEAVIIRVERDFASPMLSVLLHSKFADGPRMEFLTSRHVNEIIRALMAAASLTDYMAARKGMSEALAPVVRFVEDWAEVSGLTADETAALLRSATYPYRLS